MGPMNEITRTFDHPLTQLTLVRLRVKVTKCKLWNPLGFFLGIQTFQGYTLIIDGLCILGVQVGSQNFIMNFLDETLS
jgi:hypothetical protein